MASKRFVVPAPSLVGKADPLVAQAFETLAAQVQEAHNRLDRIPPSPPLDYRKIAAELNASGTAPMNVQGLIGVLGNPQRASVTINTSSPSAGILTQAGTITLINGVLSYYDTSTNPGQWVPIGGTAVFFTDTHANRLSLPKYTANKIPIGSAFWETDRRVLYINLGTFGASFWTYTLGQMNNTLANIPVDLGTHDNHFLFSVSDYIHQLEWTGSAWTWGPNDDRMSGIGPIPREFDPSPTTGWHLYDGAVGVIFLKSDGTTGTVTLPNLSGPGPTQSYLKSGAANTNPNAPVAPTLSTGGLTFTGTAVAPTGTNSIPSFTGNAATLTGSVSAPVFTGSALAGHTHESPSGSVSATVGFLTSAFGTGSLRARSVDFTTASSAGNANVYLTGSTSAGTPAGTNSVPTLTMNSYTPTGSVTAPIIFMNNYTPVGTISGTFTAGTDGEPENIVRRMWFRQ